ncbi:uncharacterized protein LOC135146177 [Zophobas morio]|uniref:uncharacterized protein LOC135146177 n=1 Tax=Zophobas morio TaxID=2755281 RepID=UPI003082CA14
MTTRSGKCFVPMCRTGYKGATGKFSLFRAPHDENLLQIWQRKIPRGDRNLTSRDVVCERHFTSSEIIKEWNSGSISIPYKRPKLKHGAIPTIFPNCPSYLTTATVSKRRIIERHEIPSKRAKMEQLENLEPVDKTVEDPDVIKNPFKDLLDGNIPFQLPPFCNFTTYGEGDTKNVLFSKTVIKNQKPNVQHVLVNENFQLHFFVNCVEVNIECNFEQIGRDVNLFEETLKIFMLSDICIGGPKENLYNVTNSRIAKFDSTTSRWRHNNCIYLLKEKQECCIKCGHLYKVSRSLKSQDTTKTKIPKKTVDKKSLQRTTRSLRLRIQHILRAKAKFCKIKQETWEGKLNLLPTKQKDMILECLNLTKFKSKNRRRYTANWIMSCMLLYIKSTSTYEHLRRNDILPLCSISTVRHYLRNVNIACGLDNKFFELFKKKLLYKNEFQKDGLLLFDEVQVKSSVTVNPKTLQLDGFTNFGIEDSTKEKKELVDHALVFMFSALHDSFVQPVAVYGVKGATKGEILAQIILKIIIEITKAGGNVRGIICDGATTNRKMWSILGISGQKNNLVNSFKNPCNDEPIYAFSDTPYLFKCVRNRMYNQPHLVTPFGKILWSYYEALYELDKKNPGNLRVCKKLSYDHINPTNFLKMRVKLATQIFSNSVADGLTIYKERNPSVIDDNVKPTIQFTKFMNSLFDVLNRKCYLDGIYNDSKDFDILQKGLQFLDEWEDLKVKGYITEREGLTSNTLEGLRVSIQSTIDLTTLLLSKGYKYVATAKINQDPLENLVIVR